MHEGRPKAAGIADGAAGEAAKGASPTQVASTGEGMSIIGASRRVHREPSRRTAFDRPVRSPRYEAPGTAVPGVFVKMK